MNVWMLLLLVTGAPLGFRALRNVIRGHFATDIVASLAILTALLLHQPLPGLIVVLMQAGGEALERRAAGRASAAVRALESLVPTSAARLEGRDVHDVSVNEIEVGNRLLLRPGEVLAVDGVVERGEGHVDLSRMTGESIPRRASPGTRLPGGAINGTASLEVRATSLARDSEYAMIVELVRTAQASRSPMQCIADRYAAWFTPATLAVCGIAWLMTGSAERVLSVLVVATPCPLILAAPIALIGGINAAARRGMVLKSGMALEGLASIDTIAFDKTGTLTLGRPAVTGVRTVPPLDATCVLGTAAALEMHSSHPLAAAVVDAARVSGLQLPTATNVRESPGDGIEGRVQSRHAAIGSASYVRARAAWSEIPGIQSDLCAWLSVNGRVVGAIEFDDTPRPEVAAMLARLSRLAMQRSLLLSGDEDGRVQRLGAKLGIETCIGSLSPGDKASYIHQLQAGGHRVLFVGDGTNDAPALTSAVVGVAVAGQGGGRGIATESADAVLLTNDLCAIADSIAIARRTMVVARQSVLTGLGLSVVAMGFAAAGFLAPIQGAVLQEVIDVCVILNALRAARHHQGKTYAECAIPMTA